MMYLQSFSIKDIKCFGDVEFDFLNSAGEIKRWCVILGENGTGKSTVLQSISLALMGPEPANRLARLEGWVRAGVVKKGTLTANILTGQNDRLTERGKYRTQTPYQASYVVTGDQEVDVRGVHYDRPTVVFDGDKTQLNALKRGPLSEKSSGWFSAGYGPFRRLLGGSPDSIRLMYPGQKEARFVTLFREDAALEDLDEWLKRLDHRSREDSEAGQRAVHLKSMVDAVTGHLLPVGVRLSSIGPNGALFNTPYRADTPISELSDGYRSMLALAADLLRRLDEAFDNPDDWIDSSGRIIAEGVVLIDELDAHLHPTWQREIGFWLKEQFPNMQFIVTTHSPFISQAADTDGIFVLRKQPLTSDRVEVSQDFPTVRGWRAEQILNALFSLNELRDPETERKMRRHAELQAKVAAGAQLTLFEGPELADLKDWLSKFLSPPGNTVDEMKTYKEPQDRLEHFLKERRGSGDA